MISSSGSSSSNVSLSRSFEQVACKAAQQLVHSVCNHPSSACVIIQDQLGANDL